MSQRPRLAKVRQVKKAGACARGQWEASVKISPKRRMSGCGKTATDALHDLEKVTGPVTVFRWPKGTPRTASSEVCESCGERRADHSQGVFCPNGNGVFVPREKLKAEDEKAIREARRALSGAATERLDARMKCAGCGKPHKDAAALLKHMQASRKCIPAILASAKTKIL